MIFTDKDLVYLIFPLSLAILVIAIGLFRARRRGITGLRSVGLGVLLLLAASNGTLAHLALAGLEYRYPPFDLEAVRDAGNATSSFAYVVVLGGQLRPIPQLPITSRLNPPMLIRLIEGIRLYRALPGVLLLLSGGGRGVVTEADAMAELAGQLGVPEGDIVLERESLSTYHEGLVLQRMLGDAPFLLVTSARHMPRAMALFHRIGLHPTPAPTDYHASDRLQIEWRHFIPNANYLWMTSLAIYEYLGLLREKLAGRY